MGLMMLTKLESTLGPQRFADDLYIGMAQDTGHQTAQHTIIINNHRADFTTCHGSVPVTTDCYTDKLPKII